MKKLALALIASSALLTGCIAYEVPSSGPNYGSRDRDHRDHREQYGNRDRDGDGVSNRNDRRPDDARRY